MDALWARLYSRPLGLRVFFLRLLCYGLLCSRRSRDREFALWRRGLAADLEPGLRRRIRRLHF